MSTLFVNNLNTASGSTITVPTGKKLVVTDGGGVTAPGMILQTVRQEFRTYVNTASTSYVTTGITATITPKATSSLILVNIKVNGCYINSTAKYIVFDLYKASSSIATLSSTAGYVTAGDELHYGTYTNSYEFEDAPSTTSATTYALYWKVSGGTAYINNYNVGSTSSLSTMSLQEIAQ
tara:strand:- start:541 stop:1077 length:537 start_codon:yes stop_codon:yes gene_type:complete